MSHSLDSKIDIYSKSYSFSNTSVAASQPIGIDAIIAGMLGTPTGATAGKGATVSQVSSNSNIPVGVFSHSVPAPDVVANAWINWILLDEQFKYVASGASRTGAKNTVWDHHNELSNIPVTKNGYMYVYCSNQSPVKVFFDNVQVVHTRGALLEENHYYPFGLTMAGISSSSANSLENLRKYNKGSELQHKEFSDGSGLELYTTNFRSLDPQLGRWWQIDPKPDMAMSPYLAMGNNPVLFNDPLGDTSKRQIVPLYVPEKKIPNIYLHTLNAQKNGKPVVLDYDKNKKNADLRRRNALKGHTPPQPGNSLDEYPLATTTQGGAGASVQEVPAKEQQIQGGIISSTAQAAHMQTGDQFIVIPIPDADNPKNYVPAVGVNQQQKPNDNGSQNAPGTVINMSPSNMKTAAKVGAAAIVGYILYKAAAAALTWECAGCGAWLTP